MRNILLLMMLILSTLTSAQELTYQQKSQLKNLENYLQKAETATSASVMESYLRYAKSPLDKLQQEIPENESVVALGEKYQRLIASVETTKTIERLNSEIKTVLYRLNRYSSPDKVPQWEKKSLESSLQKISDFVSTLKESKTEDEIILKGDETIIAIQKLLGVEKAETKSVDKVNENTTENTPENNTSNTETPVVKLTAQQIYDLKQLEYYLERAKKATNADHDLKRSQEYIDKLQKQIPENEQLKSLTDLYQQLAKTIQNKSDTNHSENNKEEVSTEEKNAIGRLRSIFSFSKNTVGNTLKILEFVKQGQRVSSQQLSSSLQKLQQYIADATPHITTLKIKPELYAEQIKTYEEMVALANIVENMSRELGKAEYEANFTSATKYLDDYLSKTENILKTYYQEITSSQNPEEAIKSITRQVNFNMEKIKEEFTNLQKRYAQDTRVKEYEKSIYHLENLYKTAWPQMQIAVNFQQSNLLRTGALDAIKRAQEVPENQYQENSYSKEAVEKSEKALSLIVPYADIEFFQQHIEKNQEELEIIRFTAVDISLKKAHHAVINSEYANWVSFNIKEANWYAGNSENLILIVKKEQTVVTEALCKRSFSEDIPQYLAQWKEKKWKHLVEISKTSEECKNVILKHTNEYGNKNINVLLNIPERRDLSAEEQEKKSIALYNTLQTIAEFDARLHQELTENKNKIDGLFLIIEVMKEFVKQQEQEKAKKKKIEFESSLSAAQNAVYQEWSRIYPDEIESKPESSRWLYEKSINNYVDERHTYLFDDKGILLEKNIEKLGGGNFHDWIYDSFHKNTTYTTAITVYKNGTIYGYYEGSWKQIAELKENNKAYGYHDGSWIQIGEIQTDGDIYGYYNGSWMHVATIKDENTIIGYHGNNSWGEIASFKNDKVSGYNLKGDWTELTMDIASRKYQIAVITLIILRRDSKMYK